MTSYQPQAYTRLGDDDTSWPQPLIIQEQAPSKARKLIHREQHKGTSLWLWWFLTCIIIALIVLVVALYHNAGNFSSSQKHLFNAISTALLLALGLNFFVSAARSAYFRRGQRHGTSSIP